MTLSFVFSIFTKPYFDDFEQFVGKLEREGVVTMQELNTLTEGLLLLRYVEIETLLRFRLIVFAKVDIVSFGVILNLKFKLRFLFNVCYHSLHIVERLCSGLLEVILPSHCLLPLWITE